MRKLFTICVLLMQLGFAKMHVVLLDCTGSFIGKNAPSSLKIQALKKLSVIIDNLKDGDTLVFIPIRANGAISSLNQLSLVKARAKRVYDQQQKQINAQRVKAFVQAVLAEVNKPASGASDIITAVNYAASICRNSADAILWILSDGDDNVSAKMFSRLNGITVIHLFVFSNNSAKINSLVQSWEALYRKLGAKSVTVLDAPTSINYQRELQ